jgi:hypothetical protein
MHIAQGYAGECSRQEQFRKGSQGRFIVSVGFFPNRESMYKEIQLWIATNKLEMLMNLCNCCTYKALECTSVHQCRSCFVRSGIIKLARVEKREAVEDEELLGVC